MIDLDPQSRTSAWLERAWLARYLDRTLDEDEMARFEAYVLDKPELLREIDADTAVRDSMAAASPQALAAGTEAQASAAAAQTSAGAAPAAPARRRLMPWFAAAASLLLGLALGQRLSTDGTAQVQASPGRVVFDTLRGEGLKPRWDTAATDTSGLLIVDVAVMSDAQKITARLPDGRELVLSPSAEGFATFIAPRALLLGKKVELSVTGADGQRHERTLEFK